METMHLLKTTQDIQRFVRINLSVMRESFLPYEVDARNKFLVPYLGSELHDELLNLYNQSEYPGWATTQAKQGILDKVLYFAQNALAKFTMYLAAPHMDLHLSEMGFVVTHSQNAAPASAQRVENARNAFLEGGYDNLETLLRFLESKHAAIDSYKDSEAFVLEFSNLINSAGEFDSIVPISKSRLNFIALRSELQDIKNLVIEPAISPELFAQLVDQKRSLSLCPDNKKLLALLQKAMAYMALANTMDESNALSHLSPMLTSNKKDVFSRATLKQAKERLLGYGRNYLAGAKKLLDKYPEKYPLYKNSEQFAQSDRSRPYENQEGKVFIFGQPALD